MKSREDLDTRKTKVNEFVAVCNAFLEFTTNSTEYYRRSLDKQQLSPRQQKGQLKLFGKSIAQKNPQIIALREADVRRGESLLEAVTFLDKTWGEWNYIPAGPHLQFKTTAEKEEYDNTLRKFQAATDDVRSLREQMKSQNHPVR